MCTPAPRDFLGKSLEDRRTLYWPPSIVGFRGAITGSKRYRCRLCGEAQSAETIGEHVQQAHNQLVAIWNDSHSEVGRYMAHRALPTIFALFFTIVAVTLINPQGAGLIVVGLMAAAAAVLGSIKLHWDKAFRKYRKALLEVTYSCPFCAKAILLAEMPNHVEASHPQVDKSYLRISHFGVVLFSGSMGLLAWVALAATSKLLGYDHNVFLYLPLLIACGLVIGTILFRALIVPKRAIPGFPGVSAYFDTTPEDALALLKD